MGDSLNYSFDEVCDYWIKTNHIYSCNLMIMDRAYFDSLPEDIQNAVVEAADYAGQVVSEAQQGREEVAEQELIDAGKTVIEVDNAAFAEHFKDYAATEFPDLADWVARIVAAG